MPPPFPIMKKTCPLVTVMSVNSRYIRYEPHCYSSLLASFGFNGRNRLQQIQYILPHWALGVCTTFSNLDRNEKTRLQFANSLSITQFPTELVQIGFDELLCQIFYFLSLVCVVFRFSQTQFQIQFYWTCSQKAEHQKAKQTMEHCIQQNNSIQTRHEMQCIAMK